MSPLPRPLAQSRLPLALSLALLGAVASTQPAFSDPVPFPYFSSFEESEGFDLGPFTSDPIWTSAPGLDLSITDIAYDGDQSLRVLGSGWLGYAPTATGATFGYPVTWVDLFSRPVFAPQADLPASISAASATATGFVKLGAEGEIFAVDGSGEGGGDWIASGVRTALDGDRSAAWLRLTYRIDYAQKTWDLYLNGALALADLGFIDNELEGFTRFSFHGDASTAALLDSFYAGELNPLFADANNQGIPDAWFLAHGLSGSVATRYADSDQDGLTNLQEYLLGLNPALPDSDGDGIHDGREMLRGTNPLVADTWAPSAFPFADGFELDAPGALSGGTRQWAVTLGSGSSAEVVTGAAAEGARSLRLSGADATLSRDFAQVSGVTAVWIDFQAQLAPRAVSAPEVAPDSAAAFYFSSTGDVMAFDGSGNGSGGGTWYGVAQLPAPGPLLPAPAWHRYTLHLDYAAQTWSLWFDGVRVARDFGFAHPVPFFSGLRIAHDQAQQATGIDDFSFAAVEPIALDNDGDGMPNAWEVTYGLDRDSASDASTSLSNDGWTNLEKFGFGGVPTQSLRSSLPFHEPFEQLSLGSVHGQNNWVSLGASSALVQGASAQVGVHALELPASDEPLSVGHTFGDTVQHPLWYEFHIKPAPYGLAQTPELPTGARLGLAFREDGKALVYWPLTQTWEPLAGVSLDLEQWQHVGIRLEPLAGTWRLFIGNALAGENLPLLSPGQPLTGKLLFTGGAARSSFVDEVRVSTSSPHDFHGVDTDGDGLPDEWEIRYLGGLSATPSGHSDGDILSNIQEYETGRLPQVTDDYPVAALYVVDVIGDDSLYNGRSVWPDKPSAGHGPKSSLSAAFAAADSTDRIFVVASSTAYPVAEGRLSLSGKNIILRPVGEVKIR